VLLKQFDLLRKIGVVDRFVVGLQLPLLLLDPGELFSSILRMRNFLLTKSCADIFKYILSKDEAIKNFPECHFSLVSFVFKNYHHEGIVYFF
jgi:hypothetical protein